MPLRLMFPAVSLLLGCHGAADSSDSPADSSTDTSGTNVCGDTAVYDEFAAGMDRQGDGNLLNFTLAATQPSPLDKGDNVWSIDLASVTDGAPVSDETLTITPFMPEHGHGTNPATVTTTSNGDGSYTSESFDLFMGGLCEITLTANGGPVGYDTTMFTFCIQG